LTTTSENGGRAPLESLRSERYIKRWERRKEMVLLFEQGYAFSDFVGELSKKYQLKSDAVERDWYRRKRWMPVLAEVGDKKFHVSRITMRIRAIMDVAWETYRAARKAKNTSSMVGAVEKLIRVSQHEVDIMQSIGVLTKEPEKIDAFISGPGALPWEQVPEVKLAMDKLKETFKAEHDAANAE